MFWIEVKCFIKLLAGNKKTACGFFSNALLKVELRAVCILGEYKIAKA
jgi:hypothetical protein